MLRSEFLNSVVVHSDSATEVSPISRHLKYSPRVLFRALNTSLNRKEKSISQNLDQIRETQIIKSIFPEAEEMFVVQTINLSNRVVTYSFTTKKGSSKDMTLNG